MSGALHVYAGTNNDFDSCCNDLYYQDSKADLINESIVNDMETEARWTCACTTTDSTCIQHLDSTTIATSNDYRTALQSLVLTIEEDFFSDLVTTLRGLMPLGILLSIRTTSSRTADCFILQT